MAGSSPLEHYSVPRLAEAAISCIDSGTGLYEMVANVLLDSLDIDAKDHRASRSTLESELKGFLNEIKGRTNPGSYFERHTGELTNRIRSRDLQHYQVLFPLNITFDIGYSRDEFASLGYTFERLDHHTWIHEHLEPAEDEEDARAHPGLDGRLSQFLDQIPDDVTSQLDWTYWTFEIEARDPYFPLDRLVMCLEYLLGRINIAYHVRQPEGRTVGERLWPSGWSDIRLPPLYLAWRDGSYYKFARGRNLAPRKNVSIPQKSAKHFEYHLNMFPDVRVPLEGIEEYFVEAVRRFQSAITENDRSRSFLGYWRGLETLMLTQSEQPMNKVIERAAAPLAPKREELFSDRLNFAREKRNDLVHGEGDFTVNRHDQNLLKLALENAIFIYCNKMPDWSRGEFQTFLENAGKGEDELVDEKGRLSSNLDVIESLLEDVTFEEGFFLGLLRDWLSERNRLEDEVFIDPWRFFCPVFGVGDDGSDIMVIDQAPTYPTGEEPIRLRSSVPGPRRFEHFWESADEYREMCEGIVLEGDPDGIATLLAAVADEADLDVDELYYTTLQKDGRFDEGLDETTDGQDPEDLNRDSIAAWEAYLREEIEEVEPRLIITLGSVATENVIKSVNPGEPAELDDVGIGRPYWVDRYGILRLPELLEIDLEEETPLDGAVEKGIDEL